MKIEETILPSLFMSICMDIYMGILADDTNLGNAISDVAYAVAYWSDMPESESFKKWSRVLELLQDDLSTSNVTI